MLLSVNTPATGTADTARARSGQKPRGSLRMTPGGGPRGPGDTLLYRRATRRSGGVAAAGHRARRLPDRPGRVDEEEPRAGRRVVGIGPGVEARGEIRRAVAGGGPACHAGAVQRDGVTALGDAGRPGEVRAQERPRATRRRHAAYVEALLVAPAGAARDKPTPP